MHRLRTLLAASAVSTLAACGGGGGASVDAGVAAIPPQALAEAGHALRRLGFGPTPAELLDVAGRGVAWYVEAQLHPETIDEASSEPLATWLALLPTPQSEADDPRLVELVETQIARALYSPRQLVESMALFWDGHFNTNYWKLLAFTGNDEARAVFLEWRENEAFRAGALGRFEDLLRASATSPAMLVMLDNVANVAGHPNENYARELVELFTLGVDNGYTQEDVEELARCFTGWGVCEVPLAQAGDPLAACGGGPGTTLAFHFDPSLHDGGPKTIFAGTPEELALPARAGAAGLDDGFDVLRHLARLPRTAEFLCGKLACKFVGDAPSPELVAALRDVWLAEEGAIAPVLRALFASPEFLAPETAWSKVETPFESLCSTVRALEGRATREVQLTNFRAVLELKLHSQVFRWLEPDGAPEEGPEQLGTARMLGRIAFHELIYTGQGDDLLFDIQGLVERHGARPGDAPSLVRTLGRLLHQERFGAADEALGIQFATTDEHGAPLALDPLAQEYPLRLKQLAAFLASLPQGLQQ